jgi:6-phosphogluconolactonase
VAERMLVFAGSYAEAADNGVYVYSFDEQSGELQLLDQAAGLKNPTFLNVDVTNRVVYAISEAVSPEGKKAGEIVAFAVDSATGKLSLLNRALSVDAPTCHIQRDNESRYLLTVSYHGGMVGLMSIAEDSRVGELLDSKQHEGRSVHPERQDRPHPHSTFFSPDGRYLFVQDLGLDTIFTYAIDTAENRLTLQGKTKTHPGAGPRHLSFHPSGNYAFVINEVDSTVSSFAYDRENGQLSHIETVPTLPPGFEGENTCAEIAVSADGRFVYGSNRGHDSIVVYAADSATGKLTLVEHVSAEGAHPRHFALTPGGRYLLCASRDTNNIAVFRVDRDTGRLTFTGKSVSVSKPVCVQPFIFPV